MDLIVWEDIIKLLLAMLLGGLVGAEREYRGKSAGLRTTILICVGSALFTIVSGRFSEYDRIASNIVNGIGFLGAGIIFRQETGVQGLTTAATIWSVAAIGMAIGGGFYDIAVGGFVLIGATLLMLSALAARIGRISQDRQYRIVTIFKNQTLIHYEMLFKEFGLQVQRQTQQRIGNEIIGYWRVSGPEDAHERCIQQLLSDPEVKEFTF
ncbi:putative Mg2+ transporter-C (MgtC) family protein [Larkinella arboricola]|uniref:Putative Mg2+ transporter-C (MgtC) family protein n=1 Tax=Larkinella arboricola TaxID=643671 RepID=A0A327X978_LARAB|nr:MgtC/SapB family protein [Larkinella arboricola]RAK02433.1 putative Mg2+ transporter-C (MgtC) family protein [Larkinella arboricola]